MRVRRAKSAVDSGGRKLAPRVPREVYFGPRYRVTVAYVTQQVLAELQGGERHGDGVADYLEGYSTYESGDSLSPWIEAKIYIYNRGSLAKKWEVFRHELTHVINDVHDLNITWERERRERAK